MATMAVLKWTRTYRQDRFSVGTDSIESVLNLSFIPVVKLADEKFSDLAKV